MTKPNPSFQLNIQSPLSWGLLGVLAYVFVWGIIYSGLVTLDGHLAASPIYESKYPFAFARELLREGNFLWFKNPFGSLDSEAKLFNFYASFLRLLHPLWNSHTHFFDHFLGLIFSFFLFRELRFCIPGKVSLWLLPLFFVGGGMAAFAKPFLPFSVWEQSYLFGLQPLTYLTPATSWIFFQFLLIAVLHRSLIGALLPSALLALLLVLFHPFFGSIALLTVFLAWRSNATLESRKSLFVLGLLFVGGAFLIYCAYFWPKSSLDAYYFRETYRITSESGAFDLRPWIVLANFSIPIGLLLAGLRRQASENRIKFFRNNLVLVGVILFLTAITLLPSFGLPSVPQSGRWAMSTLYWLPLLLLFRLPKPFEVRTTLLKIGLAIIILDGLAGAFMLRGLFRLNPRKHFVLNDFDFALLNKLKELPPGVFVALAPCNSANPASGDFEYLLSAETHHTTLIGHTYFTPYLDPKAKALTICPESNPENLRHILERGNYVLAPRTALNLFRQESHRQIEIQNESDLVLLQKN